MEITKKRTTLIHRNSTFVTHRTTNNKEYCRERICYVIVSLPPRSRPTKSVNKDNGGFGAVCVSSSRVLSPQSVSFLSVLVCFSNDGAMCHLICVVAGSH